MGKPAKLLRIYTDEAAFIGDEQVSNYISSLARELGMAGVTVVRAVLGYGHSAHIHRRRTFEHDRALVIEIIEEEAKLRSFVAALEGVPEIGLMTVADVEIIGGEGMQDLTDRLA